MRFLTLFLAFFVAFTSAARFWHYKPHTTDDAAVQTATVSVISDPSCKKDSDCGNRNAQCMGGICIEKDVPSGHKPTKKDEGVSVPWVESPYHGNQNLRREELGAPVNCENNNDCAEDEDSLASDDEGQIMEEPGGRYAETDSYSGRLNIKKRKSTYQLRGDADDGSDNDEGCDCEK